MQEIGRVLIVIGFLAVAVGVVFYLGWAPVTFGWMGHLPGDIRIERGDSRFYFPIVTCIVLSVVLSVLLKVIVWLRTG